MDHNLKTLRSTKSAPAIWTLFVVALFASSSFASQPKLSTVSILEAIDTRTEQVLQDYKDAVQNGSKRNRLVIEARRLAAAYENAKKLLTEDSALSGDAEAYFLSRHQDLHARVAQIVNHDLVWDNKQDLLDRVEAFQALLSTWSVSLENIGLADDQLGLLTSHISFFQQIAALDINFDKDITTDQLKESITRGLDIFGATQMFFRTLGGLKPAVIELTVEKARGDESDAFVLKYKSDYFESGAELWTRDLRALVERNHYIRTLKLFPVPMEDGPKI